MKPSEAPAEFILTTIGNLYDRPQMYCRTLGECDLLVYFAHYLWAEIADREEGYLAAGGWGFNQMPGFHGIKRTIEKSVGEKLSTQDDFSQVISFWTNVDKKLGINPLPDIDNRQFE